MDILFFDDPDLRRALLPFTFTRPTAELRIGILTIREKWLSCFKAARYSYKTESYLQNKFPFTSSSDLFINGSVCPNDTLVSFIQKLQNGEALMHEGITLAYKGSAEKKIPYSNDVLIIKTPADLFTHNGAEIRLDYARLTRDRVSAPVRDAHTITYGEQIFLEDGVKIRAAIINAEDGPVYIGKNADIQEGAIIKGPFAACEGAVIAMGAKMRGDNTIGPFCKVGGEVGNTIFFGYSNKVHDGYIGNSVIGEWCNLAAGTNISNLKNNYSPIKVYSYPHNRLADTGKIFHGLLMGDYSRCGINSMFNTGTVVGVSCNIYDAAFPPKFVPSFSWGSPNAFTDFRLADAFDVAEKGKARRNEAFTEEDKRILTHVFEEEASRRAALNTP